jgi:hypothetical protein
MKPNRYAYRQQRRRVDDLAPLAWALARAGRTDDEIAGALNVPLRRVDELVSTGGWRERVRELRQAGASF